MGQDVYGAYGTTGIATLKRVALPTIFGGLLLIAFFRSDAPQPFAPVFIAASFAALAFYILQSAGFTYHRIPLKTFLMITAACLLISSKKRDVSAALALIVIVGMGAAEISRGFHITDNTAEVIEVAEAQGGVRNVMAISTELNMGPGPALEIKAKWASHYPATWLVPGAVNRLAVTDCTVEPEVCVRLKSYLDRNRKAILDDITRSSPDMLIIHQRYNRFKVKDFSWLKYMDEDPAWAELFANYAPYRTTDRAIYYRLQEKRAQSMQPLARP